MHRSVRDLASHFGVVEEEVARWIAQGAPIALDDVDVAEVEAWRASHEWGPNGAAAEERPSLAGRMSREEAESQKLREEALKFRAEALRLYREASHLQLRWWQKPGIWLAILPIILTVVGGAAWFVNAYYDMQRIREQLQLGKDIESLKTDKQRLEEYTQVVEQKLQAFERIGKSQGKITFVGEGSSLQYKAIFDWFMSSDPARPKYSLSEVVADLVVLGSVTSVTIDLDFYELNEAALEGLAGLQDLDTLTIVGSTVDLQGLSHLRRAKQLRNLTVKIVGSAGSLDSAALQEIAQLRQLESLTLSNANLDAESLKELRTLRHLTYLALPDHPDLGPEAVLRLKALNFEYLETLDLSGTGVGTSPLELLAEPADLPLLKELVLRRIDGIDDAASRFPRQDVVILY